MFISHSDLLYCEMQVHTFGQLFVSNCFAFLKNWFVAILKINDSLAVMCWNYGLPD